MVTCQTDIYKIQSSSYIVNVLLKCYLKRPFSCRPDTWPYLCIKKLNQTSESTSIACWEHAWCNFNAIAVFIRFVCGTIAISRREEFVYAAVQRNSTLESGWPIPCGFILRHMGRDSSWQQTRYFSYSKCAYAGIASYSIRNSQ